jgi:molybdopterin-guanine dinucleotide biosynthesis protein A
MPTDAVGKARVPGSSAQRARCTGVVLAGGLATRYGGRPKGLERVEGVRIIDRVADALRAVADDLLLIANDPRAAAWLPGIRVASDVRPGMGALGGLHAALARAGTPVLVVAWDMPFASPDLLTALRALGEEGFDVALPERDAEHRLEPLCAYYAPTCIAAIEHHLDIGDRRAIAFHGDVRVGRLDAAAVAQFGDPARVFLNVNAPDDLLQAGRWASSPP